MKKISINLPEAERKFLKTFIKSGKKTGKELERAYILLALHKKRSNKEIEDNYYVNRSTIWRTAKNYQRDGLQAALKDKQRPGQPRKYSDKQEAEIIATACSESPKGTKRWTLRLLTAHLRKQGNFDTINRETVRLTLKKTNISLG